MSLNCLALCVLRFIPSWFCPKVRLLDGEPFLKVHGLLSFNRQRAAKHNFHDTQFEWLFVLFIKPLGLGSCHTHIHTKSSLQRIHMASSLIPKQISMLGEQQFPVAQDFPSFSTKSLVSWEPLTYPSTKQTGMDGYSKNNQNQNPVWGSLWAIGHILQTRSFLIMLISTCRRGPEWYHEPPHKSYHHALHMLSGILPTIVEGNCHCPNIII